MRDRIWDRHNCLEPKFAITITRKHSSAIRTISRSILNIIKAIRVGFPNIDLYPANRVTCSIFNRTKYKTQLPVWVMRDCFATMTLRRFTNVEGAENGAFCAA